MAAKTANINELIQRYYDARLAYERAKDVADDADRLRRALENEVIDAMLNENTRSIGRVDGTTVVLKKGLSCSVTQDNYDEIRRWLIDTLGDDKDFVIEAVSKSAVLDYLRNLVESGTLDEHEFPSCLAVSTRPTLSVNGWKALHPRRQGNTHNNDNDE